MLAVAAVVAVATAVPAAAATPRVVGSAFDRFVPADQAIERGDSLTLVNLEASPHDIVSVDVGDDGRPLFESGLVSRPGDTSVVAGVESLEPGIYQFYCSVHEQMTGTVSVA